MVVLVTTREEAEKTLLSNPDAIIIYDRKQTQRVVIVHISKADIIPKLSAAFRRGLTKSIYFDGYVFWTGLSVDALVQTLKQSGFMQPEEELVE